jgi:hypothetical protein
MQSVPKIVLARLQSVAIVPPDFHPDADLLTAFAEHSLKNSEREQLMDHLARCGECRDVVALALPIRDNAALPDSASSAHNWFTPAWLSWPILRWGVVAAGIALVTCAGVLEYNHRPRQRAALIAPLQQQKVDGAQQKPHAIPNAVQHQAFNKNGAPSEIATPDQVQAHFAQDQTKSFAQNQSNNVEVVRAKDAVTPQAAKRPGSRWSISSTGALQRSFDDGLTWQNANVAFAPVDDSRMESAELKKQEGPTASGAEKTGTQETLNPTLVFRAVTALGPEVWAGGNSVMLYHSLDSGSHWMRVEPLETGVSPAGDILTVEFSDRLHGKFLTSTGELWTTSDDGQTWHKQ